MSVPPTTGAPPFGGFGAAPAHSYHVRLNGQQHGPMPFEQMRQAAVNGQLRLDTPVWRDGLPSWLPASEVPELAALLAPAGPPPFGGFGAPPTGGPPPFFGV